MDLNIPKFSTKKELFSFLVENEDTILDLKIASFKEADSVSFVSTIARDLSTTKRANNNNLLEKDVLEATLIINTTNIMDSHKDVHIPGLWDKSLKENKRIKHLQEHVSKFDHIIASHDDVKAYVKNYKWRELGYKADGETQALVFESKIRKERNAFMHEQYAKNLVDNHSVGMRYVKLVTCINDDEYGAQKEAWDKYYPMIVNKEEADRYGYFWAVTEAKCIEGSAVVDGSNFVTPTQSIKTQSTISEKNKKYLEAVKNWLQ